MQFYPCVVFLKETDVDNAVEFKDGQWHFYAAGDIGNSKKNTVAQGMDPENHKEFIVEVSNNTDPQCRFLSDDLSNEEWGGDTSFEMRYQNPNCTEEEIQAGRQAWNDLLTWVVNADSETFVKEFEQHFIKDSLLFYYLFTERHTMVDNRAKNTFWHTEDLVHWDLCMDYDNDTAMDMKILILLEQNQSLMHLIVKCSVISEITCLMICRVCSFRWRPNLHGLQTVS